MTRLRHPERIPIVFKSTVLIGALCLAIPAAARAQDAPQLGLVEVRTAPNADTTMTASTTGATITGRSGSASISWSLPATLGPTPSKTTFTGTITGNPGTSFSLEMDIHVRGILFAGHGQRIFSLSSSSRTQESAEFTLATNAQSKDEELVELSTFSGSFVIVYRRGATPPASGAPPSTVPPASTCPQASGQELPVPELAAPEPASVPCMTLQIGKRNIGVGETVRIPVFVIKGANVANINYTVQYDPKVVSAMRNVKRGPGGNDFLGKALGQDNTEKQSVVLVGLAQTTGDSAHPNSRDIVSMIDFKAVGKPGDRSPLHLTVTTLNDPSGVPLRMDTIDGFIQIVGPDGGVPGDCDGDGILSEPDALCALQVSVELIEKTPGIIARLDLDGDNDVTSRDSAIILQRSVGRT